MAKPKLAIYWAASCGGCDIAILDIEAKILDVADFFDLVFWPVALDFKYDDIRRMDDKSITLTLFNGAIRNDENFEIARLLRQKSVVMCAFGSCATEGGIPALANLYDRESIIDYAFHKSPSVDNPDRIVPEPIYKVPEGTITIPAMWNTVRSLGQTIDIDYIIPGCPPQSDQIINVVEAVIDILSNGKPLPAKGTILGATDKSCCDECKRQRNIKKIKKFIRPFEKVLDPDLCLLEQGVVCMGPATRAGCGAKCVSAGVPCRGCYSLPTNIRDQGAKMASALASVIDSTDPAEINAIIETIPDPIGTFYRFSLAESMLRRVQI
ncbi:MAG: oxidoreductase [candidate division Zixibacteria bacterium RBG_16_53_22]|nr:MAG: oxidoreductase [candidate division Zixibacteria bacterium RBG_16_53_22]